MDRDFRTLDAIVLAVVSIALVALILLARGTPDHSRYDDAPVTSRVEIVA
jgi:hypothetical protein